MKTRKIVVLGSLALALVSWASEGFLLEEKTHQYLNEKIAQMTTNGFSLSTYLKNNLGFNDGAKELLSGYSDLLRRQMQQEVFMWMGEGGIKEDRPGTASITSSSDQPDPTIISIILGNHGIMQA